MFLHLLNDAQQKAFLALAQQFIAADNVLHDQENNLYELLWAETGLPLEYELPAGEPAELLREFDTRQARAAAILELIGIGHADDDFCADESAFIRKCAEQLGVSEGEVQRMESWVERQLGLAKEAESFWGG